jgi:hypothetical protein
MNYISLDEFKKAWVFRHKDLVIEEADLDLIKPMTAARSAVLWTTMISREKDHPDFFDSGQWPGQSQTWLEEINWEKAWEQGNASLPDTILEFLGWEDNTTVYFCMSKNSVIETSFFIFKKYWQNFMFLADGCVLVGKKRDSVIQFLETGTAKLGKKPKP